MSKLHTAARVILGLIFFVFGGMGVGMMLGWMKMPETPPLPPAATAFMTGIMGAVYFFPLLKITETLCGFLLLINRAAPAALVILAPITLNIFLFHFVLTPGVNNLFLPLGMILAHVLAISGYWGLYRPLFFRRPPHPTM